MNQQKVHPGPDGGQQPPPYYNPQQQQQPMPMAGQPGIAPPPPGTIGAPPQQWAPAVQGIPGCPPGLEYLTQIDQVLIKQQVDLIEVFVGWEQANKYRVTNNQGQQIYFAAEESSMIQRQCCGSARGFTIHVTDNMNTEVLRLRRDFKCCAGCCWCAGSDACAHEVIIEAPIGHKIGSVRQEFSKWSPRFSVRDVSGNPILNIHGPCCVLSMPCCEDNFKLWSVDDTQELGVISKKAGLTEIFTDANSFGASFPMNLDVKAKAAVLGAVFLIDFMFFESAAKQGFQYH